MKVQRQIKDNLQNNKFYFTTQRNLREVINYKVFQQRREKYFAE